jgi:transcriptional regulator with XRE-family HTH domain
MILSGQINQEFNMRAKSEQRLKAELLRRVQGLSYTEISTLTGINKSTLSGWLRDVTLLPEQVARLQARLEANRGAFAARALPINRDRHQRARQASREAGAAVVAQLPELTSIDELALAMLYLGEGAKQGGSAAVANMDPHILQFFIWGLQQLYQVDRTRLHMRLHLIEAARAKEAKLISWWSEALGCSPGQFKKTQYDRRSKAALISDGYHGVCVVSYYDTFLQQRLIGLAQAYLSDRCCRPSQQD